MAFCSNCGNHLADGVKFCSNCGKEVTGTFTTNRKISYDGEIRRCPNCGEILDAYEAICKSCGYELRGTRATSSVQILAQKLEEIERTRPYHKASILDLYTNQGHISKTDEQKINLIQNYPIPNTKEDIIEFAVMAISNVDTDAYSTMNPTAHSASKQAISTAWLSKFEQAYQKGHIMFGDSTELQRLNTLFLEKKKAIQKRKNEGWKFAAFGFLFLFSLLILFYYSILFII